MYKSANLNYRLEVLGNSLFTLAGSPSGGFTNMITTTHPLMVYSNIADNAGLTILSPNTSGLSRDGFRMFSDNDAQMHIRSIGSAPAASVPKYNVTFENDKNSSVTSWLGYNSFRRSTIIKDDFSTNPAVNNYYGKLIVESQNSTDQSHRSAIVALNTNATNTTNQLIGIWAEAIAVRPASTSDNIGGLFRASNSPDRSNIAVFAGVKDAQGTLATNFGLYAETIATGSNVNYGIRSIVEGASVNNYGISTFIRSSPTNSTNYAGHFRNPYSVNNTVNFGVYSYGYNIGLYVESPNVAIQAVGVAGGTSAWIINSDSILKTNVRPITDNLSLISQLQVRKYNYDKARFPQLNLMGGIHYGFIAQQVASVMPELVTDLNYPGQIDSLGKYIYSPIALKGLNYTEIIPLLVGAVMELKGTLDSVIAQYDSCCNNLLKIPQPINPSHISEIELTNTQTIILEQNVPNPFETETTISYNIPDNVSSAKIIFFNNNGTVLKELDIKHKGKGTIKVYAPELSTGIYSYSLIADDKVIDTKKMMKAAR